MQMEDQLFIHIWWYGLRLVIFEELLLSSLQEIMIKYLQVFLVIFPEINTEYFQEIWKQYLGVFKVVFPWLFMELFQDIMMKYLKGLFHYFKTSKIKELF